MIDPKELTNGSQRLMKSDLITEKSLRRIAEKHNAEVNEAPYGFEVDIGLEEYVINIIFFYKDKRCDVILYQKREKPLRLTPINGVYDITSFYTIEALVLLNTPYKLELQMIDPITITLTRDEIIHLSNALEDLIAVYEGGLSELKEGTPDYGSYAYDIQRTKNLLRIVDNKLNSDD